MTDPSETIGLHSRLVTAVTARLDTARKAGWAGTENWSLDPTSPYGPKLITGPGEDDHWDRDVESVVVWTCDDEDDGCPEMARGLIAEGRHMAVNDPARIIRDCERDLRVLDRHRPTAVTADGCRFYSCRRCATTDLCAEIADLVYAFDLDEVDR